MANVTARPIVPGEFDASKVRFTTPKKITDKKTGKTSMKSSISYDGNLAHFETPWLYTPFGVKSYMDEGQSWSITLSAPTTETAENADAIRFFDEWQKVDESFSEFLLQNSQILFNKQYSPELWKETRDDKQGFVVRSKETDGVTYRNMSFKIYKSKETGFPDVEVYSNNSAKPTKVKTFEDLSDLITGGTQVRIIFQIRFNTTGKHSITSTCRLMQYVPRTNKKITGYAFSGPVPTNTEAETEQSASGEGAERAEENVEDSGEVVEEVVEEEEVEEVDE